MTSSWGTTETAPLATAAHFLLEGPGNIGVPVAGVELKLVPSASKLEIRVRGLNVSPGYWKRPDLTAASYDDEGFYRPGDAVRFADPDDPARGLIFDGRTAEDFKLTTGTWVNVGSLRVAVLGAASPALHDVVVCGENRDSVGLLCWLNAAGCRTLIGEDAPSSHAATRPGAIRYSRLYRRRSRRFGLGFESAHAPVPLTELEEALLVGAGAGFTGLAFWDLPTPAPYTRL
jgi:feruloyl-CoA synthase